MPQDDIQDFIDGNGNLFFGFVFEIFLRKICLLSIGPGNSIGNNANFSRDVQQNACQAYILAYGTSKIARRNFVWSHTPSPNRPVHVLWTDSHSNRWRNLLLLQTVWCLPPSKAVAIWQVLLTP